MDRGVYVLSVVIIRIHGIDGRPPAVAAKERAPVRAARRRLEAPVVLRATDDDGRYAIVLAGPAVELRDGEPVIELRPPAAARVAVDERDVALVHASVVAEIDVG